MSGTVFRKSERLYLLLYTFEVYIIGNFFPISMCVVDFSMDSENNDLLR